MSSEAYIQTFLKACVYYDAASPKANVEAYGHYDCKDCFKDSVESSLHASRKGSFIDCLRTYVLKCYVNVS